MLSPTLNRRNFLASTATAVTASLSTAAVAGPPVVNPRATDGDDKHEPDWDQRLTITVGQKQADIVGSDDKAIQAAVDYVARLKGGTVHVMPGTYTFRNAVFLPSGIRLRGDGDDTILTKIPSETIALDADSDWYDREITLKDAKGFQVGDGIALMAKNPHNGGNEVLKRTLIARSGNRFKLDRGLRTNMWLSGKPTCSSLFPLLTADRAADVVIESLTLDGNRKNNANFNGNYGGCIFLQDCNRFQIRQVTARNYNGDGISFQICHDVRVEDCHSHDNADLGLHPGSGSQRPVLLGNRLERNTIGLFWCWGVKFGLAENNRMHANRRFGISIGHNDTDNVMRNNDVTDSGEVGILFRDDTRGRDFWANRNVLEKNRVINSGGKDGVAIDIQGKTKDLTIRDNDLKETRAPMNRTGIRISADAKAVRLAKNTLNGFSVDVRDMRSA